jgi:hypothetical protein
MIKYIASPIRAIVIKNEPNPPRKPGSAGSALSASIEYKGIFICFLSKVKRPHNFT